MAVRYRLILCAALIALLAAQPSETPTGVDRMGIPAFAEEVIFSVELDPQDEVEAASSSVLQVEIIRAENDAAAGYIGKRVLIYHTHTYESYEREDQNYQEIEKWRTADSGYNVVAVGRSLAANLAALGMVVVHDTTAFEPPDLDHAYDRSLSMLEQRTENGERYDLYIDLHRDAIASSSTIKRTVNINGEETARFMVLIGKGTTGGYVEKPDWERNLVIAQCITDELNIQCTGLARDVKIKTGRFNQHVSDQCVLIECGMNTNTLDEVLAGVPYLAQAIAQAMALSAE